MMWLTHSLPRCGTDYLITASPTVPKNKNLGVCYAEKTAPWLSGWSLSVFLATLEKKRDIGVGVEDLIKSLPQVLRATGDSDEVAEAAALAAWKHVAGEGLRDHAVATRLLEGTLVVEVRDTIWQKQLATMKRQLNFKVNSTLGQPLVKDIELRINPKALSATAQKPTNTDIADNEVPLELWSAASAIEDKNLRQKFLKAAMGALRRNVR